MALSQKEIIMQNLEVTEEQADEILAYDKAVDRDLPTEYDLPKDKEKQALKMANVGTKKPTVYKFTQRKRKENPQKQEIIAEIFQFLNENASFEVENLEITNKERQIFFKSGENSFEITLTQKRKPKD
jgi:hypothetical protein